MSESNDKSYTCLRIPGNLGNHDRLKIDAILNEAAGGDYVSKIIGERLVSPSIGFTLNDDCQLDLCLNFQLSAENRVALNSQGVDFLPPASAKEMNRLRWH